MEMERNLNQTLEPLNGSIDAIGSGKRLISIDLLRGVAIFFMTIIHTWTNVMDLTVFGSIDIANVNIFVAILGVLLFTLGHSRSLFLFLSAIIHQFNFLKAVEKGRNHENLLVKNLVKGLLMYALGLIRESIFNPWHGVLYLYPIRVWTGVDPDGLLNSLVQSQWQGMYLFETLQIIGLALIFITLTNYVFVKIRKMKRHVKNFLFYAVFAILAFTFLFATPFMQVRISEIVGWDITIGGYFNPFSENKEKFTRLIWYAIAGLEEPIFPNFFCVCLGCIFGYRLTQPNTDKHIARRWSLFALGLIMIGLHYWIFVEHLSFSLWFRVSPVWFLLINQGLYILYVCLFMRLFEFRKSADLYKYARNSTFLRRWGLLALSVYMLQLLDIYPRKLFTMITGMDFITHGKANMLWACILMVVAAFYFEVILRLWEKSGFLYLIILLPFLPILAIFPKTRAMITWNNAKKIAQENNFVFSFEWIVIFITKTISMVFSFLFGIVDVILWVIISNKRENTTGWKVFLKRATATWKNITFSRIKVEKSLYGVEPYIFIEHELKSRLEVSV
ncbi:MAG: hypothetical protein EU530_11695 [Promethearchaeota archaeon]|nr:MAG: hypothetical protein EU530_11695 [Candidatus Lokiarchaeota archaeon]